MFDVPKYLLSIIIINDTINAIFSSENNSTYRITNCKLIKALGTIY